MLAEEEGKVAHGPAALERHPDIDLAHRAVDKVLKGKSEEEIAEIVNRASVLRRESVNQPAGMRPSAVIQSRLSSARGLSGRGVSAFQAARPSLRPS